MTWQDIAIPFIQGFESCKLTPYKDSGGIWTCGWGSTGSDVIPGTPWTQDYADSRFEVTLHNLGNSVDRFVKVPVNQNQKAALVSFCYNVGIGAFQSSTLLKKLNMNELDDAADQFTKWDHDNGKEVAGLLRRRLAEQSLFLS